MDVLREFVRSVLREAAVPAAAAAASGVGFVEYPRHGRTVLYETEVVKKLVQGKRPHELVELLAENERSFIVGSLSVHEETHDVNGTDVKISVVSASAARRGFGPLLYDLRMSEGYLASDRGVVSYRAKELWAKYEQRNDVECIKLNDGAGFHAEDFLNKVYRLKSPVDSSALEQNHEMLFEQLAKGPDGKYRAQFALEGIRVAAVDFVGRQI